jgi:hypothetical protein
MPREKELVTHAMFSHNLSGGTGNDPIDQQIRSPVVDILFDRSKLVLVKRGHDHADS